MPRTLFEARKIARSDKYIQGNQYETVLSLRSVCLFNLFSHGNNESFCIEFVYALKKVKIISQ